MTGKKFKQRKTDVIQNGIVYRMQNKTYGVYTYTDDLPEKVIIPDKIGHIPVTFLHTKCFFHSGCREVILPNTIEVIKSDAFRFCENLEEISIPNTIKEVQSGAFKRCDKLKQTLFSHGLYIGNAENPYLILRTNTKEYPKNLVVEVHPKTKFILDTVFTPCRENGSVGFAEVKNIQKLILHDHLIFIDDNAFSTSWVPMYIPTLCIDSIEWLCKSKVKLPGRLQENFIVDGKETNGTLTIPSTVTDIPYGCFRGYHFIKKVCFEGNISTIGSYAFAKCKNLKEIHFPPQIECIDNSAFSGCPNLNEVNFYKIEKIANHAFELDETDYHRPSWNPPKIDPHKAGLNKITFHNDVGEICDQSFTGNLNLKTINGLEKAKKIVGDPFGGTPFKKTEPSKQ